MAASMKMTEAGISEQPVLESLNLLTLDNSEEDCGNKSSLSALYTCVCALCDEKFDIKDGNNDLLRHLLLSHKLVIAEVHYVADLKRYLVYWKRRFKEQPITDFCSVIKTNTGEKDIDPSEDYYLLCDVLPEDKSFRQHLQKKKLGEVLLQQQRERDDETFCRTCLFCRTQFNKKSSELLDHMAHDHGFSIGLPNNLVFIDELLEKLQDKLKNLQCLHCERTFRDRAILKEHMRKKQHKKVNPKNKTYDKYYIINYLEMGKNWEAIQQENDRDIVSDDSTETEDEWEGWREEAGSQAVCLYCMFSSSNPAKLSAHMQELHDLDFQEIKLKMNLDFYQQVKLINFIRRQVHLCTCIGCQTKFEDKQTLLDHMHELGHTNLIPEVALWDQPQYFFPTYENDNLLCQIQDDDGEEQTTGNATCCKGKVTVIAEDVPDVGQTILSQERVRQDIIS
ncbi:zinc finger protein 277-like [Mizuhopecten yessoensis]|uniref:zinc finger protein 277-like n=1 Tax=Mizuhopecten yessoensis TaxID=6573 RepID=UPI000B45C22A|nr:zinc finger protein 277-like [Mizuhopecten yessoensis]